MGLVVKFEASFSGGKDGLRVDLADLRVEVIERGAKRMGQVVRGKQRRPFGTQDAEIELRGEEGHLQAVGGGGVAMRLRDAMDEAFEPQPAQVIGHLGAGVGAAEERLDRWAQVAVSEAAWQMRKGRDRLEERHHARVTEAEG